MRDEGPEGPVAEATGDEGSTREDAPGAAPTYDRAPPTVEERLSPFHPAGARGGNTTPGMPPPVHAAPAVRPRTPTTPGMAGIGRDPIAPPRIVQAPEAHPPDGPTDPDGVPAAFASGAASGAPDGVTAPDGVPAAFAGARIVGASDGATDPGAPDPATMASSAEGWDGPTDPGGWRPSVPPEAPTPSPQVPAPDAPSVEISKSLELQAAQLERAPAPDPTRPPSATALRRAAAQAPTQQLLPALERPEADDGGSDGPLILGLVALALVILALLGAVGWGVLEAMGTAEPAAERAE